jgi:protein-tyrosine phosphatase
MIDLHAHVLPGFDDGPESWDESLRMCRTAVEDGTTTLVATPHITPGVFSNRQDVIVAGVEDLVARLAAERIPLEVVASAEVWLDPDLLLDGQGIIPYLGGMQRFVLLHLPPRIVIGQVCELFQALAGRGITPIVTHPERQRRFQDDPEQLRTLIAAGALSQVTAASLSGKFGRSAGTAARRFLELGLVHAIASDAHSMEYRPPGLSAALAIAAAVVGDGPARALVLDTPQAILEGRLPQQRPAAVPVPLVRRARGSRLFPFEAAT